MSLIAIFAAVVVTTAGCGNKPAVPEDTTGTPTRNGALSTGAARPATELVRVTGKIKFGSVPECMVLDADFTKYVLVGGDPAAIAAYEEDSTVVTVTGQAHTPTPAACADGVPLAIQKIEPAV